MQEQQQVQYQHLTCQQHKQQICYLYVLEQQQDLSPLRCQKCVVTSHNKGNSYLQLSELLNHKENEVLENYPPLAISVTEKLKNIEVKKEEIKMAKEKYFDNLKQIYENIVMIYQNFQNELFAFFDEIDDKVQECQDLYTQSANISNLQQIIQNNEGIDNKLIVFLRDVNLKNKVNSDNLSKRFFELDQMLNLINKDSITKIQNQGEKLVNLLNLKFNPDDIDIVEEVREENPLQKQQFKGFNLNDQMSSKLNAKDQGKEGGKLIQNQEPKKQLLKQHAKNLQIYVDLLSKLEFQVYQESQLLLERNQKQQIEIYCQKQGENQAFSEFIFEFDKKYILNIEYQPVFAGSKIFLGLQYNSKKPRFVELQELQSNTFILTVRVDISNKIFSVQSNYSKSQKTLEKFNRKESYSYRFAVKLQDKRQEIKIVSFHQVDHF